MEPVLFEKDGPIGWLTLNRPDKRNALSVELMSAMLKNLKIIARNMDIRVVVIKGNGPAFCAGHDLDELTGNNHNIHHFREIFIVCAGMMQFIHEMPQPVIAQVHGIATAAGCQLVAACDLAIAETDTQFATPGVKIGLFCITPSVPLVRVIGRRRALDMLLSGRFVSAQEAVSFGLVNKTASLDTLFEETRTWALQIAGAGRFTLEFGKHAFYKQIGMEESSAYDYATQAMVVNCLAEDAQEGMKAFLDKRKPNWKNR